MCGPNSFISWSIYYTGGAVNTARAFGPAVVTGFPYGTHWVVRMPPRKTLITLRICLVLGWSVPRVVPRVSVLRGPEAVRYQLNFFVRVICNDNYYFVAGNTGLLTKNKQYPTSRVSLASNKHTVTIMRKEPQAVENLQWISREHRRTTWFDFSTKIGCRNTPSVERSSNNGLFFYFPYPWLSYDPVCLPARS